MPTYNLKINGKTHTVEADSDTPLLWILRDHVDLVGTKYGCGIAQCGACTVYLNGEQVRSCVLPVTAADGKDVTTIEGLSANNDHPVQKAWIEEQVPQCGYCQSGQIMVAAALLEKNPSPTDEEIEVTMRSVLCRCGAYPRIMRAIKKASNLE